MFATGGGEVSVKVPCNEQLHASVGTLLGEATPRRTLAGLREGGSVAHFLCTASRQSEGQNLQSKCRMESLNSAPKSLLHSRLLGLWFFFFFFFFI